MSAEVIQFPEIPAKVVPSELPAKVVPFDERGPFTFPTWADTNAIRGTVCDTSYQEVRVLVDPDAELEDDCLIILQLSGSRPCMACWRRTGRDIHGRFIPVGDPREAFYNGYFKYTEKNPLCDWWRILGRVVSEPRRI